ncbi:MAG: hypothetical protein JNK86_08340 [Alphaproteobacteria bacterium]|nr:hypothetical protein [Alphaproteobacteria bacterium]
MLLTPVDSKGAAPIMRASRWPGGHGEAHGYCPCAAPAWVPKTVLGQGF